jgi:glutathione synthase/RimK-type ligase-like ATP-grasp enzyme
MHDLAVLFEHPQWQEPLFSALRARGVDFIAIDLKRAAHREGELPEAKVYFNQASPSAYVRGHTRAVPYALAMMESLEIGGAKVLNGPRAFLLELSKAAQVALMRKLGIDHPRTIVFNEPSALAPLNPTFPAILKPNQGGSGARMFQVDALGDLEKLFRDQPDLWLPDNLFLLQEKLEAQPGRGIVRLEFLGGELLYAMRVIAPGQFNLCPSEVCHPVDGDESVCEVPVAAAPVEFLPYPEVPREAVEQATKIVRAGGLDVGGIEYLDTVDGRRVFYDVNANSNLRPAVARAFGFDPFERVVDFLVREVARQK